MTDGEVRGDLEQGAGGKFEAKYSDEDVVDALVDAHPEPLKVGEVADRVGSG